jgi:hypothetical protein
MTYLWNLSRGHATPTDPHTCRPTPGRTHTAPTPPTTQTTTRQKEEILTARLTDQATPPPTPTH